MKHFFLLAILLFSQSSFASHVRLTFRSSDTLTVKIAKPIDGIYNSCYYQDTLALYPGVETVYDLVVDDFSIVNLSYSNGKVYDLYVAPNNNDMILCIKKRKVTVYGKDSLLNLYLNEREWIERRIYEKRVNRHLERILLNTDKKGLCIDSLRFCDSLFYDSLLIDKDTSEQWLNMLNKRRKYVERSTLIMQLNEIKLKYKEQLSSDVFDYIAVIKDSIFASDLPESTLVRKYMPGMPDIYLLNYLDYSYRKMTETEKDSLLQGYDKETFGPYRCNLLLPDSAQLSAFLSAFILQYKYGVNEFDKKKMLMYLYDKFPASESYSICRSIYEAVEQNREKPIIVERPVNSLEELFKLDCLKGKYLYIDVWATWCIPCLMDFAYKTDLQNVLIKYPNLKMVYLSIDESQKVWKERVLNNLSGIHLRASQSLIKELKDKIYEGRDVYVPRYFLLSSSGEIINSDMPSPRIGIKEIANILQQNIPQAIIIK